MSPAVLPPRRKQKLNIDREEFHLWLRWAFLVGIAAAILLWSGCSTSGTMRPGTKSPASLKTTYTVPDSCHTVLDVSTDNVRVILQKGCTPSGIMTAMFIVLHPKQDAGEAGDDAGRIMTRFFDHHFELSPLSIFTAPSGRTVIQFVVLLLPHKTKTRIRRDMKLQRRHRPK